MVSALGSGSGGQGSSIGGGTPLCSWARQLTVIVPLFTQVYKKVPTNLLLGVTLRWSSTLSKSLHATETGISSTSKPYLWSLCRILRNTHCSRGAFKFNHPVILMACGKQNAETDKMLPGGEGDRR